MEKKYFKSKIYWISLILTISTLITIVFWTNAVPEKNIPKIPPIKTQLVEKSASLSTIKISGFIRGTSHANIAPLASGTVTRFFKQEGDFVKQGEIIAIINSPQAQAGVEAASASVESLKKILSESEKYYEQLIDQAEAAEKESDNSDTSTEAVKTAKKSRDLQLQTIHGQLVNAQGNLLIAQSGKNNLSVTAPFSGTITALHNRTGGFANFSAPLFTLASTKSFELETFLTATDARKISIGSIVNLFDINGAPLTATIIAIAPGSDNQTLKTLVKISITNNSDSIRLGDFIRGEIIIPSTQEALTIPRKAIVNQGGDLIVFSLNENNQIQKHSVTTGNEYNDRVVITEGLTEGQRIVTEGQQFIVNGITAKEYE